MHSYGKMRQCKMSKPMTSDNILNILHNREILKSDSSEFSRHAQVLPSFVDKLDLVGKFEGHLSCVNCIEFNKNGNLLVSGSDDYSVILWDVHHRKLLKSIPTGHRGNIFSVKFLPQTNDNVIVSGAGDYRIEVRDLNSSEVSLKCSCHSERVKRIATIHSSPFLFFSASEDGTVMQFDTREKHSCSTNPNVLINLKHHSGRLAECKCVTVSPLRSELIAVGASDPYVRVYDRRKIQLTSIQNSSSSWSRRNCTLRHDCQSSADNLPFGCVQYFVPGHLPAKMREYYRKYRSLSTTYITFSSDGRYILANLGGDNVYLFDTLGAETPKQFFKACDDRPKSPSDGDIAPENGVRRRLSNGHATCHFLTQDDDYSLPLTSPIHPRAEALRLQASTAFKAHQYTRALRLYNDAILAFSSVGPLYSARATTLINRKWDGDLYSALRDYITAAELEPGNVRTKMRLAWCLHLLGRESETDDYLNDLINEHPQLNTCPLFLELREKILRSSLAETNKTSDQDSNKGEDYFLIPPITETEKKWRSCAKDYETVFSGHCNTTTDIKEAVFVGRNEDFIAAGSDDGNLFIWNRNSSNLVKVFEADKSIVNCVQSHPNLPLIATSGIETVIKLWGPTGQEREVVPEFDEERVSSITTENQKRMSTDPMEMMFLHMGEFLEAGVLPRRRTDEQEEEPDPNFLQNHVQCRQT